MSIFTKVRNAVTAAAKVTAVSWGVPPQVVAAVSNNPALHHKNKPQTVPVVAAVEAPSTMQGALNEGLKDNQTVLIGGAIILAIVGMLVVARK